MLSGKSKYAYEFDTKGEAEEWLFDYDDMWEVVSGSNCYEAATS